MPMSDSHRRTGAARPRLSSPRASDRSVAEPRRNVNVNGKVVVGSPPASPTESADVVEPAPPPRSFSMDRLSGHLTEHSPLLSPTHVGGGHHHDLLSGEAGAHDDADQASKSILYMILLTISIGGLQIAWTVELSNGTPYLLSLGISKSLMALVWIAGPLSGTVVQPYVGIRSDNCRIAWGKRKPFMVGGGIATIGSLLALAWTREMVRAVLAVLGYGPETGAVRVSTIVTAVGLVYILDFAINTVQAGIRAFIVDCAPAHQQEAANAWASRAAGVGNILGYLSGYVHLPSLLPFLGNTQFKILCVIASLALGGTLAVSCTLVPERDPRLDGPVDGGRGGRLGVLAFFRQVVRSIRRLPPQIRTVCEVQFFAWIGWFPFLFYITTYIGQLYANPLFAANPHMTGPEIDEVWEHATRIGTYALLVFALTSFAANIFLPFFIASSAATATAAAAAAASASASASSASASASALASAPLSPTLTATANGKPAPSSSPAAARPPPRNLLAKLIIPGLTLGRAWLLSHLLFASAMFATVVVQTATAGTVLVGLVGVSWALTLWAPFALISADISRRDARRRRRRHLPVAAAAAAAAANDHDGSPPRDDQAGIILGLHNVAIAAPQVIATLMSSVVFRVLQRPRGQPGDDSVGWGGADGEEGDDDADHDGELLFPGGGAEEIAGFEVLGGVAGVGGGDADDAADGDGEGTKGGGGPAADEEDGGGGHEGGDGHAGDGGGGGADDADDAGGDGDEEESEEDDEEGGGEVGEGADLCAGDGVELEKDPEEGDEEGGAAEDDGGGEVVGGAGGSGGLS
ncbi:MAG: hypothetical protein M1826_004946 [Phylliscum demangeonii]|nr:MAG: hypothetical protein M1826_004946 [Phylliscum demangeonii]